MQHGDSNKRVSMAPQKRLGSRRSAGGGKGGAGLQGRRCTQRCEGGASAAGVAVHCGESVQRGAATQHAQAQLERSQAGRVCAYG